MCKDESSGDFHYDEDKDPRPTCEYGALCYRKNTQHIKEFKHPGSVHAEHLASNKAHMHKKTKANGDANKKKYEMKDDDEEDEPLQKKVKIDKASSDVDMAVPPGVSFTVIHPEAVITVMTMLAATELRSLVITSKYVYDIFLKAKEGSKEDIRLKYLNGQQPIPNTLIDVFAIDKELESSKFVSTFAQFQQNFKTILETEEEEEDEDEENEDDEGEDEKPEQKYPPSIAGRILNKLLGKKGPDGSFFIVAGGCVASALKSTPYLGGFDIDIFLIGPKESPTEYTCPIADQFFRECIQEVSADLDKIQSKDQSRFVVLKNPNTLTFMHRNAEVERQVQFVLRKCSSISELLFFFDLDAARFAFDGTTVWTTEEGKRALKHRVNFVERWHRDTGVYGARASKYAERGFPTFFYRTHPLAHRISGYYDRCIRDFDRTKKQKYITVKEPSQVLPTSGSEYDMNAKDISDFYEAFNAYLNEETTGRPPRVFLTCEEWLQRDCVSTQFLARYNEKHLTVTYFVERCYMCHKFRQLFSQHATKFDRFCAECKKKNDKKREQSNNLSGRVAIVTGARIKIGFAVTLKLLRAGAKVIATTRFSADALERYKQEKDFAKWQDNLIIYPLDLKCGVDVLSFVEFVKRKHTRVHILVNNAAQTVRRPILYYKSLIQKEKAQLALSLQDRVIVPTADSDDLLTRKGVFDIAHVPDKKIVAKKFKNTKSAVMALNGTFTKEQSQELQTKALEVLSSNLIEEDFVAVYEPSIPEGLTEFMEPEDLPQKEELFPAGSVDEFGEQVDRRRDNSWTTKIDQVHPVEVLEVQAINNIAPTMLISKLLSVMEMPRKYTLDNHSNKQQKYGKDEVLSYIINVTSPEGQFYAPDKTDEHIHNNMSKAALNMLTRSAAPYYAKKGIIMVGVDTGWVSSAVPTFVPPPLSSMDGAARILDPVFSKSKRYGQLFRDFEPAPW